MPTTQLPPHPLPATPGSERTLRVVLAVIAIACLVLTLGGLATRSIAAGIEQSRYQDVPAVLGAGTPTDLTVRADVGDIDVLVSDEVDQVTLALVEPGARSLPADGASVRARWTRSGGGGSPTIIDLQRPGLTSPASWARDDARDLLVVVPTDAAAPLSLTVRTHIGTVDATGDFTALDLQSTSGDVTTHGASASKTLRASTRVGTVDLELGEAQGPATPDVRATTTTGDVDITVPCCRTWKVDAEASNGDTSIEPGIEGGDAGSLRARTEVGDVTISR